MRLLLTCSGDPTSKWTLFSSVRTLRRCVCDPFVREVSVRTRGHSVARLTALALAIPGIASAELSEDISVQYGYYQQSQWNLANGVKSQYNPLTANNISNSGIFTLQDRWKISYGYVQDTWSGATPVASAPVAAGLNKSFYSGGTVSGATPLVNSTVGRGFYYDKQLNMYSRTPRSNPPAFVQDNSLVQTVASASPEIRNQGDVRLGYEWDDAAMNVMAGVSREPDFLSNFGGADVRLDFNNKTTSMVGGISYNSSTVSSVTSSYYSYVNLDYYKANGQVSGTGNSTHLVGIRQDWSGHLNVSHVVNKDLVFNAGIGFVQSAGYLGNPYKAVEMTFADFSNPSPGTNLYPATAWGVAEKRPEYRNQGTLSLGLVQFIESFDASIHAGYRFFHDDWGITSNTFDLSWSQAIDDGWNVTPRFRYYEQSSAYFYEPYFFFPFAAPTQSVSGNRQLNLAAVPAPGAYSSDYRLSAFGAISGGLTISKKMGKALSAEIGAEYYTHAGSLNPSGSGQASWANFNYFQANGALRIDPSAVSEAMLEDVGGHDHSHMHIRHLGMNIPAGILFGHMLEKQGDVMVGLRWGRQTSGNPMIRGASSANMASLAANTCSSGTTCYMPTDMIMNMYMLDIMYAPSDWLTLMLMPQYMTMNMSESVYSSTGGMNMGDMNHSTGGLSDLYFSGMLRLLQSEGQEAHFSLGFTAPTGSVHQSSFMMGNMGRYGAVQDYGMQLGSGTWDFWPSLTYNGERENLSWGGQLSVVEPMQQSNASGYKKGTLVEASVWGGYDLLANLRGTLRLRYVQQGAITGGYPSSYLPDGISDPAYNPSNYGGKTLFLGFGLNPTIHEGFLSGNHFGVEWLQPVYQYANGYQLSQNGFLYANWGYSF